MSGYQGKKNIPRITVSIVSLFWLHYFMPLCGEPQEASQRLAVVSAHLAVTSSNSSSSASAPPGMNNYDKPVGLMHAIWLFLS